MILRDGDYELIDEAMWLQVNNLSLRIKQTDTQLQVEVYPRGHEMYEPVDVYVQDFAEVICG